MKALALIVGIILILLGIAGFAKLMVMAVAWSAVLVVAGVIIAIAGMTHRRSFASPTGGGRDMRDVL